MRRRLLLVLAAALVLAGVAGCGTIGSLVNTDTALHDAGYQSVKVSPKPQSNSVDVSVKVDATPALGNAHDVAGIVWRSFHERFDYVTITVHGNGPDVQQEYSFPQMVQSFGARNPAWNRTSVKGGLTRIGAGVFIAVAVAAGLIVAIVLLVQRRNRRRRPPWTGGPGWGPGWGGPPPGPPGPNGAPPAYPPSYPPAQPPSGWGAPPTG